MAEGLDWRAIANAIAAGLGGSRRLGTPLEELPCGVPIPPGPFPSILIACAGSAVAARIAAGRVAVS